MARLSRLCAAFVGWFTSLSTDEWVTKVEDYLLRGDHVRHSSSRSMVKKHVNLSIKECRTESLDHITDISRRQIADKLVDQIHAQQTDQPERPQQVNPNAFLSLMIMMKHATR